MNKATKFTVQDVSNGKEHTIEVVVEAGVLLLYVEDLVDEPEEPIKVYPMDGVLQVESDQSMEPEKVGGLKDREQ